MRIVYLHQYFVTPDMPGGVRSYEMARRLVAAGHEVHMVTSDVATEATSRTWRESVESGINVHWAPVPYDNSMSVRKRLQAFFVFAARAAKRASSLRGDVVFATSTPLTIAIPGAYAARRSGRPMVFEVRDLWPDVPIAMGYLTNPLARWGARRLEAFAYRSSARVVALAPGMRDAIVAKGYPADRVDVIPNGCDLELFEDAKAGLRIREDHEWLADRPLLVYTGAFGKANGVEYLVRLAEVMRHLDSTVRVAAVGGGREVDHVRRVARELGVLNDNFFLVGRVPRREAAAWTLAADMTIALFEGPEILWRDAVQNKFFDSLAAGKPVATNFWGWQSKLASEVGAGLVLSSTNTEEAGHTVVRALRDREWLEQAGQSARELGRTRFDRDKLALELERVLTTVVDESR